TSAAYFQDIFLRAQGRTLDAFLEEELLWKSPFYFILVADPQFGLMKAWALGDCHNCGDEWKEEIRLTEQAVQAINKLNSKPKFFVLCGDLIHFTNSGIKAVCSGHYHRNAGGFCNDLNMVVLSAVGCQLGKDTHGLHVVVVTAENIIDLMDEIKQE
uniref:Calcineurin-like phosphoesterase domain-containing protein n=1 Tax=Vombatus ursinus TaxID=29139 RepID=A0A4X2L1A7_VOMUR